MSKRFLAYGLSMIFSMSAFSQAKPTFDKVKMDLGSVLWKSPVTAVFKVKNTGDKPLVISKVETSCGCTAADWTKGALMPGGEGEVSATFDAGLMGHFTKFVDVYCSGETNPVVLTLQGNVVRFVDDKMDVSAKYPFEIGEIALNARSVDFGDVAQGGTAVAYIDILNTGKTSYEPILMHLPSYIKVEASPSRVSSGRTSRLKLTLDAKRYSLLGWVNQNVYLSRFLGDKVGEENEIPIKAVIVPDFSALTAAQRAIAPVMSLSEDSVNISLTQTKKIPSILSKAKSAVVDITNEGKSQLEVKRLSVSSTSVSVSLSSASIAPGETAKLEIKSASKSIKGKVVTAEILLVTNDPANPKRVVKVSITK